MLKKILGFMVLAGLTLLLIAPAVADDSTALVKFGANLEVPAGAAVDSAVAIGGSVTVSGKVTSNVVAVGGSVYLKPGARVEGDVTSIGGVIDKAPGAIVTGNLSQISWAGLKGRTAEGVKTENLGRLMKGLVFFYSFVGFVAMLLIIVVLVALFTPQVGHASHAIEKNFWLTFFVGLVALFIFIPGVLLLLVTIIGIILIPAWVILFACAKIFGLVAASHLIGKQVLKAFRISGKAMVIEAIVGALILYILAFVPIINFLVLFIAVCCGLGAVALTKFGTAKV